MDLVLTDECLIIFLLLKLSLLFLLVGWEADFLFFLGFLFSFSQKIILNIGSNVKSIIFLRALWGTKLITTALVAGKKSGHTQHGQGIHAGIVLVRLLMEL